MGRAVTSSLIAPRFFIEPATCWGFAPFFPRTLKTIKIFATFSELVPHAARAFCANTICEKLDVIDCRVNIDC